MLKKLPALVLTSSLALMAFPCWSQIFDIEVTDYGGIPSQLRFVLDNEIQKVKNEVNKDFPSGPQDRLMEGMANSSIMAAKGIGTDYASNMSVFLIGGGIGVGADLEKPKGTDSELSGVGVAPGFIVGLNLGVLPTSQILGLETKKLNLYFNFMSYNLNKEFDKDDKKSELDISLLSFGTHLRYDWIQGRGSKLLGWGGVKLTTGFEHNKTKLGLKTQISQSVTVTPATGETINGPISGSPEASILASTTSIPFAISTDVQLLYFLSLYTGAGLDYNLGSAKGEGKLNADPSTLSCTGGVSCSGGGRTITVQAKANLDTTGKVDPLLYRAFAGVQFNLPWTRIFLQVDKSLSNDLIGATAGLRFAF